MSSVFAKLRSRDYFLKKGITWSLVSLLMKSKISQASATIPLMGYMIIWSEPLLKFYKTIFEKEPSMWKMYFIYFGAIALTISWLVFLAKCPAEIKRYPIREDFVSETISIKDELFYNDMKESLSEYIEPYKEGAANFNRAKWKNNPPICLTEKITTQQACTIATANAKHVITLIPSAYYSLLDGTSHIYLFSAFVLWIVGFLMLVAPSASVFVQVLFSFI